MKKFLLVTTPEDRSVSLFFDLKVKKLVEVQLINYFESVDDIIDYIDKVDIVYFRDPFNFFTKQPERCFLEKLLNFSITKKKFLIDNLRNVEDFYFEDKRRQYSIFEDVMPETYLFSKTDISKLNDTYIVKERFSSKAKGIFLDINEKILNKKEDYIIQRRIKNYMREYRIYVIGGKICEYVSMKSNKIYDGKVKILKVIPLPKDLKIFVSKFIKKIKFDFVGLDVVETKDGKFYLLEVNRSPLFTGFYKFSNINLAFKLVEYKLKNLRFNC